MMQVQITDGGVQRVEVCQLSGARFVKRSWAGRGCQGEVLGIRKGAKTRDRFALIIQFDGGHVCLAGRSDIKILEE